MIVNRRVSQYGFLPALVAAAPGILSMFQSKDEPPPPPVSSTPYVLGGLLGVLIFSGLAYTMVKT
jgi:hypothetical protein